MSTKKCATPLAFLPKHFPLTIEAALNLIPRSSGGIIIIAYINNATLHSTFLIKKHFYILPIMYL